MWGVVLNFVATSSWHWTQVSIPTNPAGAAGAAAGAAVAWVWAPPALAIASTLMSPTHAAVRAHSLLRIRPSKRGDDFVAAMMDGVRARINFPGEDPRPG